jgi:DNA-binding MarR family transcriptional regulator
MTKSTLQLELRKKKPFELPEEEAVLSLLRTVDVIRLPFDRLFAEYGISDPQYNVLRILRGHGGRGLPCTEIAAQMVSRMPDMTRLVDRLEKTGLVRRCRTAADRRVVLICITPAGLEILSRLDQPVRERHRETLGHLSRRELANLNRLLVKARTPP